MYLSVVLLASETPRYRAPLDAFVIVLAALALVTRARGEVRVRREALDGDEGIARALPFSLCGHGRSWCRSPCSWPGASVTVSVLGYEHEHILADT